MKLKNEMGGSSNCSSHMPHSNESNIRGASITTTNNNKNNHTFADRIMCRCCLSEQLESQQLPTDDSLEGFVSLDTLALVDLRTDEEPTFGEKLAPPMTLLDCLNACAGIGARASERQLPQFICLDCCHTLETCCEFIRCVRNADKILRRRCMAPRVTRKRSAEVATVRPWRTETAKRRRGGVEVRHNSRKIDAPKSRKDSRGYGTLGDSDESAEGEEEEVFLAKAPYAKNTARVTVNFTTEASAQLVKDFAVQHDSGRFEKLIKKTCDKACNASLPAIADAPSTPPKVKRPLLHSLDSGIEYDDDSSPTKSSDYHSSPELPLQCHYESYEGYTYVVSAALSAELQSFHRSLRKAGGIKAYKCGFCIFECSAERDLHKHKQIHLGPPQYHCRLCQFSCHFQFELRQHRENKHPAACDNGHITAAGSLMNDAPNLAATTANGYSLSPTKFHCQLCSKYLSSNEALQQHLKSHKVYCQCTVCDFKSSTRENVLEHLASAHKMLVDNRLAVRYIPLRRRNTIEYVDSASQTMPTELHVEPKSNAQESPANLNVNSLISNNTKALRQRTHLCQFCGKCFERRFLLLKHEYKVHRLYSTAEGDNLKFSIPPSITTKNVQTSNKFQCEICAAEFLFNFELKYHLLTHKSEEKPISPSVSEDRSISSALGYAQAASEAIADFNDEGLESALPEAQINLLSLVAAPGNSQCGSLEASPSSSNHSGDFNYDDQLYLNEFDLGLLDCSMGMA